MVLLCTSDTSRDWTPLKVDMNIDSGLAAPKALRQSAQVFHEEHVLYSESGPDSNSFQTLIRDDDTDPSNGYYYDYATSRPLPAGKYIVKFHQRGYGTQICNFNPTDTNYITYTVTVTAPAGTLHEAFFDPVEGGEDEVSPAGFSVGGTATEIMGLEWADGKVTLSLDPIVSLDGYTLDFIELDGTASLNLRGLDVVERSRAGDGSGALKWAVADEPWKDGDKLMLRIREDGAAAAPTPGE